MKINLSPFPRRDQIVQIIERNPEAVTEVLSDREQLMRERIVNAYAMYMDPFGDKAFKEMMARSPALAKLDPPGVRIVVASPD